MEHRHATTVPAHSGPPWASGLVLQGISHGPSTHVSGRGPAPQPELESAAFSPDPWPSMRLEVLWEDEK